VKHFITDKLSSKINNIPNLKRDDLGSPRAPVAFLLGYFCCHFIGWFLQGRDNPFYIILNSFLQFLNLIRKLLAEIYVLTLP